MQSGKQQMYNILENMYKEHKLEVSLYKRDCEKRNEQPDYDECDYALNYYPGSFEDKILDCFNIKDLKRILLNLKELKIESDKFYITTNNNITLFMNIIIKILNEHKISLMSSNINLYNNGEIMYNGYNSY